MCFDIKYWVVEIFFWFVRCNFEDCQLEFLPAVYIALLSFCPLFLIIPQFFLNFSRRPFSQSLVSTPDREFLHIPESCGGTQASTPFGPPVKQGSSRSAHWLNFFTFLSVKNHTLAWRANQWPLIWETLFSSVPPSNSLVSVSDPRRAFWADTAPFSGPQLASCIASGTTEIQGHRQVCHAEVPGHRQQQLNQTLIVRL